MTEPTPEAAPPAVAEATSAPADRWAFARPAAMTFGALLLLDQATKIWARAYLMGTEAHPPRVIVLIPGCLDFTYAENTGAAFSLLSDHTSLLALFSLLATAGFVWFFTTIPPNEKWGRLAVGAVLAGAVGNLIDRVFRGFVVDFIHAWWREYHWPIFNVADSAICVGVGILMVRALKGRI